MHVEMSPIAHARPHIYLHTLYKHKIYNVTPLMKFTLSYLQHGIRGLKLEHDMGF